MKFMLMMNAPGRVPYQILSWPKSALEAHMTFMKNVNARLQTNGEYVTGEGLTGPDKAKLVKADAEGRPVTDGVFAESKEFLAGYWIVEVDRPERAYALAAQASAAPGPDGTPMNLSIEVRQVMSAPNVDG